MKKEKYLGKEEHRKGNINKLINKLNRVFFFFQSNSSRPSLIALFNLFNLPAFLGGGGGAAAFGSSLGSSLVPL